jgi:outer membrane protein insertion porin family
VVVNLKEKGWFGGLRAGTTTELKPNESARLEVSGDLVNPLGFCERFTFSTSQGMGESQTVLARLHKPRAWGRDMDLTLDASMDSLDERKRSSMTELARGCSATVRSYDGSHILSYGLSWRDVLPCRHTTIPYAHTASLTVVAEARPSLKSSFSYTFTKDGRNHPFLPTHGGLFRAHGEWAGPGGDVRFLKCKLEAQQHARLFQFGSLGFASLSLCASAGALKPLGVEGAPASARTSLISDRFFVGGPLGLRGFRVAGIGPRAPPEEGGLPHGDSLGGDLFYTGSASLSIPFPHPVLAAAGVRPQIFFNAGNLLPWRGHGVSARRILQDTRLSAGCGLSGNFLGAGRFEISCSVPLQQAQADLTRRWQFGIGVNFS